MTSTEVITSNSRSEGAKRMWEKRKAVKQMEEGQTMNSQPIYADYTCNIWCMLLTLLFLGGFFLLSERIHQIDKRVDCHFHQSVIKIDEIYKRLYEKEMEFYRLSDEVRKREATG